MLDHCEKPLTWVFEDILLMYMVANQYSPGLTLPSFTPPAGTLNSDVPDSPHIERHSADPPKSG
jgi:hypothetical protein